MATTQVTTTPLMLDDFGRINTHESIFVLTFVQLEYATSRPEWFRLSCSPPISFAVLFSALDFRGPACGVGSWRIY